MARLRVQSSGGGVQSNALIILAATGRIPRPDLIVMVDTGRESSAVFDYQKTHIRPICERAGLEYVIVKKSDYTNHDITLENDDDVTLPPFYSRLNAPTGRPGKQPGFCSDKWKKDVFRRYVNWRYGQQELTRRGVDVLLGMSAEEGRRIKPTVGKWQNVYPLFTMGLDRAACEHIVTDEGLPRPPRSACWMCPNRHDDEWRDMRDNSPGDFAKAVEFDDRLRDDWGYLYVHSSGIPLRDVSFATENRDKVAGLCDSGFCFT